MESGIQIKPSYGLTDTEIETMLRDSIAHAKEDVETRNLREQQVEADRVIEALAAALAVDGNLLSPEERGRIEAAVQALRDARNSNEHRVIKQAIEYLNEVTTEFAARRMDNTIKQALAGHRVDEIKLED